MQLIILDTETTGTGERDRICQLSFLVAQRVLVGCEIEAVHNNLCRPPLPIGYGAMAVHHITNEQVEKKPSCTETAAFQVLETLNNATNVLVIQNAPFDLAMLSKEGFAPRCALIDTLRCLKHLYPDLESHALQYVRYAFGLYKSEQREAKKFGIRIAAHDALGDVLILKLLLDELLKEHSVEALITLTGRPIRYETFKFGKYKGTKIEEIAQNDPGYLEWMLTPKENEEPLDADWRYTLNLALEKHAQDARWIFPFGKYKGQSVEEIAEYDRNYLHWCVEKMDQLPTGMKVAIKKVLDGV